MQIECDACGRPVEKELAVAMQDEEGEVFWFCSEACVAEAGRIDPDRGLERAER